MRPRPRASIRLWQTELFIVVIVVAMLILSGTLSAGLKDTLSDMARTQELRNAQALAQRLRAWTPIRGDRLQDVREDIDEYREIYETGIWVYARDGSLLESSSDGGPLAQELQAAHDRVRPGSPRFASVDMRSGGWAIAAMPLIGPDGAQEGVVVTASSVERSMGVLEAVRYRLWVTFWVSLIVAGLLGFAFSEFIGRRIRAMSEAAAAIAAGDFDQRLSTGLVPDEVYDLAASYNSMAERLGEAFGAIRESERQIAAVVESMAEGVAAFDSAGVVRVINPEAGVLLGLPHQELIGAQLRDLTDEPAVLEIVNAGLSGDRVARTVSLGRYTVQLHCTPLRDAQGDADGAVLLLSDVTEQRRIEEAQRRFVADASHEMRTPVAALKGILELLADGAQEDPAVRDDFIRTMQVEADRLGRLVSDLLTLAQLDAGGLKLRLSPHPAADLLGDVSTIMHALAETAGVGISVEVPDELCVLADRDRVVQVLLSLTDNALKHSPRDSRIQLRARRNAENVLLEVADEGRGIAPEDLPRLFERFYRADAARSGGGGAGLGLAIAKEIVEAHGSTIVVHSEPGAGTVFGFELPVAGETCPEQ